MHRISSLCLALLLSSVHSAAQEARPPAESPPSQGAVYVLAGVAPLIGPERTKRGFREGVSTRIAFALPVSPYADVQLAVDRQELTHDRAEYARYYDVPLDQLDITGGETLIQSVSVLARVAGTELGGRITPYFYAGPGLYWYRSRTAHFRVGTREITTPAHASSEVGVSAGVGTRVRLDSRWHGMADAAFVLGAVSGNDPVRLMPVRLGLGYRLE